MEVVGRGGQEELGGETKKEEEGRGVKGADGLMITSWQTGHECEKPEEQEELK